MQLTEKTVYFLDGQEFRSMKQAQAHLENQIGKIIDGTGSPFLDAKQKLALFTQILANKKRLVECLTVEIESDEWQGESRNLLDLDR